MQGAASLRGAGADAQLEDRVGSGLGSGLQPEGVGAKKMPATFTDSEPPLVTSHQAAMALNQWELRMNNPFSDRL